VVTPGAKNSVGEIVDKLGEIDDLIDNLESPTDVGNAPDKNALLQEISKLSQDVNKLKRDQGAQIKTITDDVRKNTKNQILESVGDRIQSLIVEAVAAQTKKNMHEWSKESTTKETVKALQETADQNNGVLGEARVTLENSLSRHANSTLDLQDDFSTKLKTIRRQDGCVSELFPLNLRELFSYDDERLVQLLKQYGLRPLGKHIDNLTRFLIFIGVNQCIPDQLVNTSDEQPPAYGNAAEAEDRRDPRGARGGLQDSKQTTKSSSWWS